METCSARTGSNMIESELAENLVHDLSLGDGLGLGALSKAVLELALHTLEVPHAAGACGSSPLGLLRPLVAPRLGSGVAARRARLLLLVEGDLVAPAARGVRLGLALTERLGTLRPVGELTR
jgi:hypothetical protein